MAEYIHHSIPKSGNESWIHFQNESKFHSGCTWLWLWIISQRYWWHSVIPDAKAVSLKVLSEGPLGTVSMSRNENENNSCQGSPSHQWEGWINQHAESNSPTAKDESSNSSSRSRCHPETRSRFKLMTNESNRVTGSSQPPSSCSPPCSSSSHHCSHQIRVRHC